MLYCPFVANCPLSWPSAGDIINIITQSMLIRFVNDHIGQFKDLAEKTIAELNLGMGRPGAQH